MLVYGHFGPVLGVCILSLDQFYSSSIAFGCPIEPMTFDLVERPFTNTAVSLAKSVLTLLMGCCLGMMEATLASRGGSISVSHFGAGYI